MNTKISYLYRDADNYKMHNKCVIAGTLTTEQARTIKDSCEMGEYFIPRQVGLPERRFKLLVFYSAFLLIIRLKKVYFVYFLLLFF